jgi:uncharacterized protein (TIGR02328 family)
MRIWDVPPDILCRKHLLGEHRELHALWSILSKGKKGYQHHPETKRWINKLPALYKRHELLVSEMQKRGYHHGSPLDVSHVTGSSEQYEYVTSLDEQMKILREKPCECPLDQ